MNWRLVENEPPPKDGTTFLGWSKYFSEPVAAQWNVNLKRFVAVWDDAMVIDFQSDFGTEYKDAEPLTHWMPFPNPPESTL